MLYTFTVYSHRVHYWGNACSQQYTKNKQIEIKSSNSDGLEYEIDYISQIRLDYTEVQFMNR